MQSLSLKKGKLVSKVIVPSSKSYANRALILCALLKDAPKLLNLPLATDVTILLECFEKIGLIVERNEGSVQIKNSFPACETPQSLIEIAVGEGGTTARFLAALLLLGSNSYRLILGERLKERPWQEFINLAHSLGGQVSLENDVLTIQGPITLPSVLEIDCTKTTQFASAFQLTSLHSGTKVVPLNLSSSQSYWAMTEKLMQEMTQVECYPIPLDWSSASYPLAFGALNQHIEFPGLFPDALQADSKFYQILQQYQALALTSAGIEVHPVSVHHSLTFDVSDALDLVPTLGYFLAHIEGEHQLDGIQNLVHKESDRLGEVIKLLKIYGREARTDGRSLFIKGNTERVDEAKNLVMPNDHRMVMVGTLFLLHHAGGTIAPTSAVEKSYPGFFDLLSGP